MNIYSKVLLDAQELRDKRRKDITKGLLIKSMAHEEFGVAWKEADKKMFDKTPKRHRKDNVA